MARKLIIMKRAENAIYKVASLRAEQYRPATGVKYINDVIDFCVRHAALNMNFPLCKNQILSKHEYSCLVYKKKWVIAFKYTPGEFRIYRFIWGANLK